VQGTLISWIVVTSKTNGTLDELAQDPTKTPPDAL